MVYLVPVYLLLRATIDKTLFNQVVTFELDGLYTRYGEGRAVMTLPLSGPLPYSGLAFGVGVDVSDYVWSGENLGPRKHSR